MCSDLRRQPYEPARVHYFFLDGYFVHQSKMQSIIVRLTVPTRLESSTGHIIQVRNHVKNYPWRIQRDARETYLDPTEKPYTDRLNMNEFNIRKRQLKPWMKVIPKEKDNRFNSYKWNDSYKSDPKEAKQTSESRWHSFAQSVQERGSARESKPYSPPDYDVVRDEIIKFCESSLLKSDGKLSENNVDDILNLNLNQNHLMKFKLISKCIKEFDHHLPTPYLNEMNTVNDLVVYFSTPVRGLDPYSSLARKEDELPINLTLISEAHRWDKENDQIFGGYNAYPGLVGTMPGLRGKKKYATLNQDEFQWPDI